MYQPYKLKVTEHFFIFFYIYHKRMQDYKGGACNWQLSLYGRHLMSIPGTSVKYIQKIQIDGIKSYKEELNNFYDIKLACIL